MISKMKIDILKMTLTFSVAAVITGAGVLITRQPGNGKGGLEMSAVPQYNDETLTTESQDLATLEESEKKTEEEASLYYKAYRVKKGDMIGIIAEDYGVTQDTLISVNNIRATRLIQVGQYLKIPSMPGILYTIKTDGETPSSIAEKYGVDSVKCAMVNNLSEAETLKAGSSLFVPDAEIDWITRQEINGDLFYKPLKARYRLTSYFGWRPSPFTGKRSFHGGIDMACPTGTAIYAALGGKVSAVGYNNTYGNYIIISHHSGYRTLYGHMSKTIAVKGQYVTPSTVIGRVGSTGASTGPHLHFTVFKNGKMVNPLNLVG